MQEILESIVLGIVQGITEFLPVSSSGHLEIVKFILGADTVGESSLLMTVSLHFATALSTIIVFRKDIWNIISKLNKHSGNEERSFAYKIIFSMMPAAFVGVFFEDLIESLFTGNLLLVGAMLLLTALLLWLADKATETNKNVSFKSALIIGIAQAIAIIPGISRSGATISTSVLLGVDRAKAARFSFLMVVPLIFGKIAKDLLDGDFSSANADLLSLGAGFIAAFVVGIAACTWMIQLVKSSKLKYFSIYCILVGLIAIIYSFNT